jgi:hypothetical protein
LVIDGHRDSSERVGISVSRANNARDYLVSEKGIDPVRITVRNFGDTCPLESGDRNLNRRVEFWVLPEGATLSDVDAVKRCRPGSTPQEITGEQPTPATEPARPRRTRRPEPNGSLSEPETEERDVASQPTVGSATASARSERSLAPASVVRSVSARIVDGALRIIVDTDGAVRFRDFTLTGPSRIVIDLTGVRSAFGSKTLPVASGLVERIRVGEPGPAAVRIVIDIRAMIRYRVLKDGATLIVVVGDQGAAAGGASR